MKKFKQMADTLQKRSESGKKQSDKNIKSENCKDFRKLLKEKTIQNDFRYFKKLTREKQEKSKHKNQYSYKFLNKKFTEDSFLLKSSIYDDIKSTFKMFRYISNEM